MAETVDLADAANTARLMALAAKELGITQGTVSKSLNSSNALAYLGGVGMAARLIDERYGNGGNE